MKFKDVEHLGDYFTPTHKEGSKSVGYVVNTRLADADVELRYNGRTIKGVYRNQGNSYFTFQVERSSLIHVPMDEDVKVEIVQIIPQRIGAL